MLFPRVSEVEVLVGIIAGVMSSLPIGALADMIIGMEVTFGTTRVQKMLLEGQFLERRFYRYG